MTCTTRTKIATTSTHQFLEARNVTLKSISRPWERSWDLLCQPPELTAPMIFSAMDSIPSSTKEYVNDLIKRDHYFFQSLINKQSTDALNSYPCYVDDSTTAWLGRQDVRSALHIPSNVQAWQECSDDINTKLYIQQNPDMTPVFQFMIDSNFPLKVLIYNGDVDLACNYLGDQWFVEALATSNQVCLTIQFGWSCILFRWLSPSSANSGTTLAQDQNHTSQLSPDTSNRGK